LTEDSEIHPQRNKCGAYVLLLLLGFIFDAPEVGGRTNSSIL